MPQERRSNILSSRKHFYGTVASVLCISFLLSSWLNSAYYSTPNEDGILSIEAIKRFAPYFLLCVLMMALLRCFQRRFSRDKHPIALYLLVSISCLTIIIQIVAFLNQMPILTSFLDIKNDHCLSYLASTLPSDGPHRQFLLFFRARRFLKNTTLLVPEGHSPDNRLTYLCRANIRNVSYRPEMSLQEAGKLVGRKHITIPGKGCTYILVPDSKTDIVYYHMRKISQTFFILPLYSLNQLKSPTLW